MRELLPILESWADQGLPVALGMVVERVGSAPRDPGSALAVNGDGQVAGSVTGGCVDPAVIHEAKQVLAGAPGRLTRFGLADPETVGSGLTCGGTIAVAIYALDAATIRAVADAVRADRAVAVTVSLDDAHFGELHVSSGDQPRDAVVASLLAAGESALVETDAGALTFVHSLPPRPAMYVFGVGAHAAALTTIGSFLGYRVTVCDARGGFLTPARFPDADELVVEWPDRFLAHAPVDARTAICVLTHDEKFDIPALLEALQTPARYIGAMGSERRVAERTERLRAEGVADTDLARIRAPIGLRIGGRTPNEVEVAIAAQLVESTAVARSNTASSVPRATLFL